MARESFLRLICSERGKKLGELGGLDDQRLDRLFATCHVGELLFGIFFLAFSFDKRIE